MATRATIPSYRKQRRKTGQDTAFVVLDGRRVYLGLWDIPDSRQKYARVIGEWQRFRKSHFLTGASRAKATP